MPFPHLPRLAADQDYDGHLTDNPNNTAPRSRAGGTLVTGQYTTEEMISYLQVPEWGIRDGPTTTTVTEVGMNRVTKRRGTLTAVARVPSRPVAERFKTIIERMLDDALDREQRNAHYVMGYDTVDSSVGDYDSRVDPHLAVTEYTNVGVIGYHDKNGFTLYVQPEANGVILRPRSIGVGGGRG